MRAIRFITASYAEQVAAHRRIHITACLAAFAVMLVSSVFVQSAAALGPKVSDTPSTTEPYYACPHGLCDAVIDPPVTKTTAGYELPDGGPLLEGSGEGGGYDPKDLQSAYNIPTSGGESQTVAVVDAYGDTTAESDLAKYREKYGLPSCTKENGCFKKVNQKGEEGNYPEAGPAGWELETSLDVDMVSAACSHCHILLVEATTEGMANLGASVNEAVELGATEVSNSYGAPEDYEPWCGSTGCSQYDSDYDHSGVFITASAGDYGYDNEFFGGVSRPSFPATSQYVTAVGGTSLHKASNARGWSEKVWYESGRDLGTGSGCSGFEPKPTWQTDTGCTKRTDDDVAAVGACETPVSIYSSTYGGWENVCGTSASSPLVAAIVAHTSSSTRSLGAKAFYEDSGALFDVTEGSNGSCGDYLCTAEVGYDGPTGWGTPDGLPEPPSRPSVITKSASASKTIATFNGTVNPESLETNYHFEYGTTTSYGSSVPVPEANVGSGTSKVEVSQTATSLSPETTYHYRLVAVNSDGTTYGADATITTSGSTWALKSTSNPTGLATNRLTGVSCASSSACTGVGWYVNTSGAYASLVESWNGTEWSIQTAPVPAGATLSTLEGVSCSSATACTAVGHYVNSSGTTVTLAERWNGTEWTIQSTPNPSGATKSDLWNVSCASSTACTAGGEYVNSSGTTVTLAEHWNGTEWAVQSTPNPSGATASTIQSVSCTASTACEAVGYYDGSSGWESFAERWNGTEWTLQSFPKPSGSSYTFAQSVSCTSSTACTAVGYYYPGSAYEMFAERWNGTEWTVQSTPNPSGSTDTYPHWVSCASSTACTATGEYVNSSGTTVALAEHWNGTEWTVQTTPNPSGAQSSVLRWVSCTSSTACTALGWQVNSKGITTNIAQRWNGSEWALQSTSNPSGLARNRLTGVSCASSSACTGVGWYVNTSGAYASLVESWNGTEWSIQTVPVPTGATLSTLEGVSCSSATACTAVGHYVNSSGTTVTLAERWNGTEWSIQTTPNPSGAKSSDLWGVSCSSSTSCVATGEYVNSSGTTVTLAENWNGTEWTIKSTPNPSEALLSTIQSVSCTSSTACTAMGYDNTSSGWESFAERWNGTEWTLQSMAKPSGSTITLAQGVSCTASTSCTSVGYYYSSTVSAYVPFAEHSNGTEWSLQSMPSPSGAKEVYPREVSCSSSTSCVGTGEYMNSSGTTVTLAEHWNGTEWTVQTTPNPSGATESVFRWVSCTSSTTCTALGWYVNAQGITTNLAEASE